MNYSSTSVNAEVSDIYRAATFTEAPAIKRSRIWQGYRKRLHQVLHMAGRGTHPTKSGVVGAIGTTISTIFCVASVVVPRVPWAHDECNLNQTCELRLPHLPESLENRKKP
jgi:hypothetical protein